MSAALRLVAVTLVGWAGFRAIAFGALPGADLFTLSERADRPSLIEPARFPALEPAVSYESAAFAQTPALAPALDYRPIAVPFYYPVPRPAYYRQPAPPIQYASAPQPLYFGPLSTQDQWPLARFASAPMERAAATSPVEPVSPSFAPPSRPNRLMLTGWALIRGRQGTTIAPGSLAPGGTLGGSQAGARLTYLFSSQLAASLRTTSPVGGASGGEIAAGIRYTPFASIPVAITAERRKAIGRHGGGRDAFAMFIEGGLYQRPMWGFQLDGYAQAGIVGARSRDMFADGGFTFTRPLYRDFSGGIGMWGGVQPGLYRVDAGPRLSMRVRNNMRIHLDWRQRVAGNALPRSGPAVTLAGDF
ncbi:MAG: hypothetical protein ABIO43_09070 [Sphingomicrobium sp.]